MYKVLSYLILSYIFIDIWFCNTQSTTNVTFHKTSQYLSIYIFPMVIFTGFLPVSWHKGQDLAAFGRNQPSAQPDSGRASHRLCKTHGPQRLCWSQRWSGFGPLPASGDQVRSRGVLVPSPGRRTQRTVYLPGARVSGRFTDTQISGVCIHTLQVSLASLYFPLFLGIVFISCCFSFLPLRKEQSQNNISMLLFEQRWIN